MIAFSALCLLLIAVALALLLPPLLRNRAPAPASNKASNVSIYREQLAELDKELAAGAITPDQFSAARSEIERRALDEAGSVQAVSASRRLRFTPIAIGITLPLVAIALYVMLGTPQGLSPETVAQPEPTPQQVEEMVARLAARLESNPGQVDGWIMLGRSYGALGRYSLAASAYAKAAALRADDAQLLADYADMLAMSQGRTLAGEPEALLARALKADGSNVKALALSGAAAFARGDYQRAIGHWNKIVAAAPPDSPLSQSIRNGIQEAENHLRNGPAAPSAPPLAKSDAATPERSALQGRVSLAAAAAGKAHPEDAVFVYARAAEGPRMPLAVLRRKVKDLPFEFSLDDSMAMNPSLKLSDFDKVVVVARVSKSGLAAPQKGDLEAASAPLARGAKNIRLEIARAIE